MRLFVLTAAFAVAAAGAPAKLNVVTTTEDLAAIAREVGGNNVTVSAIVTGVRDPHFIEAKPSFMSRMQSADLFIAVGLDLEIGYEQALIQGSRNSKITRGKPGHLYASAGIAAIDKPTGGVSRAEGDVHPNGNPHYWLDPYNARIIADTIADRMAILDAANKLDYQSRAAAFRNKIDLAMFGAPAIHTVGVEELWRRSNSGSLKGVANLSGWAGKLEPFRSQPIVTYHKSWNYFAKRFGFEVVGHLEPKPGIAPTPGHLSQVIQKMNSEDVRMVLQEPFYSKRSGQTVVSRTKAKLVVAPLSVGHTPKAKDYISLMNEVVELVANGMGR